ncbi:MAG: hypothetical protein RXO43_02170 [Candidatus Micrarchaeota archaeon]
MLVNKTVDTYIALIGSVIVYSINGTLDYIVISKIGLGSTVVSIGLGMLLGAVFLIPVFKSHLWPKKASYLLFSSSSAFFIVIYNLLLFIAYLKYDLASIYPLIGLSALIFFIIDVIRYKRKLPMQLTTRLGLAVSLVALGVFFAESTNFSFRLGTLPFVIGISLSAGIGYYMNFYKIRKYSIGTKVAFQPIFMLLFAPLFLRGTVSINNPYFILGVLGGFLFILAVLLELKAMKINNALSIKKTIITRNFINDFGYLDTVLVLIGSIIIGSFTNEEIFGGLLIFAGVLYLEHIRRGNVTKE